MSSFTKLFVLVTSFVFISNSFANTATIKGKTIQLRQTQEEIYFKLDNMPTGIAWFFMSPVNTGNYGNCAYSAPGHEVVDRMYSTLLSSKIAQTEVAISYCTQGSYGLVSTPGGFVELTQ